MRTVFEKIADLIDDLAPYTGDLLGLVESILALPIGIALGAVIYSVLGLLSGAIAFVWAFFEDVNPYAFLTKSGKIAFSYIDNSRNKQDNVKRKNYLFGPGYHAMRDTFLDAWAVLFKWIGDAWSESQTGCWDSEVSLVISALIYTVYSFVSGVIFIPLLTLLYFIVLFVSMLAFFFIFTIIWLIDRIYLKAHSITSQCPHCKSRFTVPTFACTCGRKHDRLVPSSYGIFHHKCLCGENLPTTFFNGRSKYRAFCPICGEELAGSDSRQFGLTMIGGSSSGKTVYLAAYFTRLFEYLSKKSPMTVTVPDIHVEDFQELSDMYHGKKRVSGTVISDATKEYSLVLEQTGKTNVQYSIFDVAGEVFNDPELQGMTYTDDMRNSNGILLMLDPFSSEEMKQYAISSGVNIKNTSNFEAAKVVNNFAVYLRSIPGVGKIGQKIMRPIAVIITKMDYPCLAKKLSRYLIGRELRSAPEGVKAIDIQDRYCREFLESNGFSDALTALEANFETIHYFPVSANGGAENGEEFDPDDYVLQPVHWLVRICFREYPSRIDETVRHDRGKAEGNVGCR